MKKLSLSVFLLLISSYGFSQNKASNIVECTLSAALFPKIDVTSVSADFWATVPWNNYQGRSVNVNFTATRRSGTVVPQKNVTQRVRNLASIAEENKTLEQAMTSLLVASENVAHEQGVWVIQTDGGTYTGPIFHSQNTKVGQRPVTRHQLAKRDLETQNLELKEWIKNNRTGEKIRKQWLVHVHPGSGVALSPTDDQFIRTFAAGSADGEDFSILALPVQDSGSVVFQIDVKKASK